MRTYAERRARNILECLPGSYWDAQRVTYEVLRLRLRSWQAVRRTSERDASVVRDAIERSRNLPL